MSLFVAFRTLSKGTRDYSELLSDTWGRKGGIYMSMTPHMSPHASHVLAILLQALGEAVDNNTPHVFDCNAKSN